MRLEVEDRRAATPIRAYASMTPAALTLPLGFLLAGLIALIGWKWEALSASGAVGATVIGGFVFGFGGPTWAVILVAFFVSSSLLSRLGRSRKARNPYLEKGGPRDLAQTLANGGAALLMALAVGVVGHDSPKYPYLALAYFGSLAAATADTWATELGLLSTQRPRLITSGEPTLPGVSGGVTPLGLVGSLLGGLFIGLTTFLTIQAASLLTTGVCFLQDAFLLITLPAAGFLASLFDSFLGATAQRLYYCERCQTLTEKNVHDCGATTRPLRGLAWMNNDMINVLAASLGALAAILLSLPFLVS